MTTKFGDVKGAKGYALSILKLDPKKTSFEEVSVFIKINETIFPPQGDDEEEIITEEQASSQRCFRVHNSVLNSFHHVTYVVIEQYAEKEFVCWVIIEGKICTRL